MGQTLETPQNTDAEWEIDLFDSSSNAITGFTDDDTLSAVVWPGGGAAAAFEPSATWIDAATGKIKLSVSASQSASLAPGTYALQVFVVASGLRRMGFDGSLSISRTVGATASGRAYTTYERMKIYAPWLGMVQDQDADMAGFQSQIEEASRWLEGLAIRHFRSSQSAGMPTDYSLDHLFMGWPRGNYRSLLPPSDLVAWLAGGGLMTATSGLDTGVSEVVALYAIGLVAMGRVGPTGGSSSYTHLAASFKARAEEKAKCLTLLIDTNADGTPDVWIDLGSTDSVYG
jgi:hypothetical protein